MTGDDKVYACSDGLVHVGHERRDDWSHGTVHYKLVTRCHQEFDDYYPSWHYVTCVACRAKA